MGLSLAYRTAQAVPAMVRCEMQLEAQEAESEHLWILCDPIAIDVNGEYVTGASQVHLFLPPEEVARARQHQSPCHDLEALLILLIQWSRRYQLTWHISLADEPFGAIHQGTYAPELFDQFDALAELALDPTGARERGLHDGPLVMEVQEGASASPLPTLLPVVHPDSVRSEPGGCQPANVARPRLRIWPEPE